MVQVLIPWWQRWEVQVAVLWVVLVQLTPSEGEAASYFDVDKLEEVPSLAD